MKTNGKLIENFERILGIHRLPVDKIVKQSRNTDDKEEGCPFTTIISAIET